MQLTCDECRREFRTPNGLGTHLKTHGLTYRRPCSIDGCDEPHESRGYCNKHYLRLRHFGAASYDPWAPEVVFWPLVDVGHPLGCWTWTGRVNASGYGSSYREGVFRYAHRDAYELLVGPIPEGLQLDHLCRNPPCVNPDHLEPVTSGENTARGASPTNLLSVRDRCHRGHLLVGPNGYVRPDGHGRQCRACSRERQRRYDAVRRASA